MVEALIAFGVSLLIVFVFNTPTWAAKIVPVGGIGFCVWVLVLVLQYLFNRYRTPPRP